MERVFCSSDQCAYIGGVSYGRISEIIAGTNSLHKSQTIHKTGTAGSYGGSDCGKHEGRHGS